MILGKHDEAFFFFLDSEVLTFLCKLTFIQTMRKLFARCRTIAKFSFLVLISRRLKEEGQIFFSWKGNADLF